LYSAPARTGFASDLNFQRLQLLEKTHSVVISDTAADVFHIQHLPMCMGENVSLFIFHNAFGEQKQSLYISLDTHPATQPLNSRATIVITTLLHLSNWLRLRKTFVSSPAYLFSRHVKAQLSKRERVQVVVSHQRGVTPHPELRLLAQGTTLLISCTGKDGQGNSIGIDTKLWQP